MDHLDGTTVHEREQTVIGVVKMWGARVWSGAAITGEMSPYGTPDRTRRVKETAGCGCTVAPEQPVQLR
jgi:hypothetical protein